MGRDSERQAFRMIQGHAIVDVIESIAKDGGIETTHAKMQGRVMEVEYKEGVIHMITVKKMIFGDLSNLERQAKLRDAETQQELEEAGAMLDRLRLDVKEDDNFYGSLKDARLFVMPTRQGAYLVENATLGLMRGIWSTVTMDPTKRTGYIHALINGRAVPSAWPESYGVNEAEKKTLFEIRRKRR